MHAQSMCSERLSVLVMRCVVLSPSARRQPARSAGTAPTVLNPLIEDKDPRPTHLPLSDVTSVSSNNKDTIRHFYLCCHVAMVSAHLVY